MADRPYTLCYRVLVLQKQFIGQGSCWAVYHPSPSSSYGSNLEFGQGAGDSLPTLRAGHCGGFNVHQLMSADGSRSSTSIRGIAHILINHSASETPGWRFIAGSVFKSRIDSFEVSVHTSRLTYLKKHLRWWCLTPIRLTYAPDIPFLPCSPFLFLPFVPDLPVAQIVFP